VSGGGGEGAGGGDGGDGAVFGFGTGFGAGGLGAGVVEVVVEVVVVVVLDDEYETADDEPLITTPPRVGAGNSATGRLTVACDMKSCQIRAGSEPPNTFAYPSTLSSGISAFG